MILFELFRSESHPIYQELEVANAERHYDFLRSMVSAAIAAERPFLSQQILKAINYHAIACLHTHAGGFRPCSVQVVNGDGDVTFQPPDFYRVQALMDDFINEVNLKWNTTDPVVMATYVLWKLNNIHPFINGNGRTARAAAHFVICTKFGGWLPGQPILPQLLKENKAELCACLKHVDDSSLTGKLDLEPLHELVTRLLNQQMASANISGDVENSPESQTDEN